MAISEQDLQQLILDAIPDAQIQSIDKTGERDHFIVRVVSPAFENVGMMDRHRMVQQALNPAMNDGRLHAVEIQTATPVA